MHRDEGLSDSGVHRVVFRHCRGPFSNVPAGEIRPGVFLAPSRGCCDISVSIPSSPLTLSAVPTFLARCPNEICQILLSDSDPYSEIGRLLADYASNPIKLCSVSVTSLAPSSMFMATKMITRYEI